MSVPAMAAYEFTELPNGDFEVTFTYDNPGAEEVYLIGQMNGWTENDPAMKMEMNDDGLWEITITLAKGVYEYKFFVDGEYKTDFDNPETTGPYNNSVARVLPDHPTGELELKGEMINEFTQEDFGNPVAFNSSLKLELNGVFKEKLDDGTFKDMVDYSAVINAEGNVADVENYDGELELLTPDKIYLENTAVTYLGDYVDVSLQANKDDKTNSYDYLGILDATTSNDDRENDTSNPNEFGDSRRIRVSANDSLLEKGYDFNIALTEYTGDITDDTSNTKYLGYLNFKKELKDNVTGEVKGHVGTSVVTYQPVVAGEYKDFTKTAAVFGEYEVINNLTLRGEYAYIPLGEISESLSGCFLQDDGSWLFIFDPRDYEAVEAKDVETVWLAGGWGASGDETYWNSQYKGYMLEKTTAEDGSTIWTGTFNVEEPEYGWKFIVNGEKWDYNDDKIWFGDPATGGERGNDNFQLVDYGANDPIKDGYAAMAEVNYRIFDPKRSFETGSEFYKFDITAGAEILENGAYLRVANDDFAEDHKPGHNKLYVNSYLYPISNIDLRLDLNGSYVTAYEDPDTDLNESNEHQVMWVQPAFDYPQPVTGVEYIKGHVEYGSIERPEQVPEDAWTGWEWQDNRYKDNDLPEYTNLFVETQTQPFGPINYVKTNVNYEKDLEITEVFAETELNVPVKQIEYIRANVDYKVNDESVDSPRAWVEGRIHQIPGVKDYVNYILVNYETDEGHIIDHGWYGDDDNDWKNRLYAETELAVPALEDFAVTVSLESQNIEDGVLDGITADSLEEDLDARYVENGKKIEWYTFATVSTGYDFPFSIRGDVTLKFDLVHQEISEYEDDALLVELSRPLTKYTTLKASYNKQDSDHGENYSSLMFETLF